MSTPRIGAKGFALTDLLVAILIVGLNAAAALAMFDVAGSAQAQYARKIKFTDVRRQVHDLLADGQVCAQNFVGPVQINTAALSNQTFKTQLLSATALDGSQTQMAVVDRSIASVHSGKSIADIVLNNFKVVDVDTLLADLTVYPVAENGPTAPIVFHHFQAQMDPASRASVVRPLTGCILSYATNRGGLKGVSLTALDNVSASGKSTSIIKALPAKALALNMTATCTIKASSGVTQIRVVFMSKGSDLILLRGCAVSGTDKDNTSTTEASHFLRIPADADSLRVDFTFSSSGSKRSGNLAMQWFE